MTAARLLASTVALVAAILAAQALAQDRRPDPKKDEPKKAAAKPAAEADDDDDGGDGGTASTNLKPPEFLSGEERAHLDAALVAVAKGRTSLARQKPSAKKELEDAIVQLKRCRDEDARDALASYWIGVSQFLLGRPKQAIPPLLTAIEANPKFHEAMIALGDCYLTDNRPREAEPQYQRAVSVRPDHLGARLRCVRVKIEDGKLKEARAEVVKLLEKHPKEPAASMFKLKLDHAIEGPSWSRKFEKETAHYIVRTDVDQQLADWVAQNAELIRRLYDTIFKDHIPGAGRRKFPITVYRDAEEYHQNGGPKNAGGHYDPLFRQLYLFKYPKESDTLLVLNHEGFHQFLHPYVANAPQWFNEGLADYFGPAQHVKTADVEGMKIVPNAWRLPLIKHVLSAGRARPMSQLMLMSQAEMYEEESAGVNYAQAWSFIYFLCEYDDRKHFPILGRYFRALRAGKDADAAYKESFGKEDMNAIESQWKAFILRAG